jgi:hypothetical protein
MAQYDSLDDNKIYEAVLIRPIEVGGRWVNPGKCQLKGKVLKANEVAVADVNTTPLEIS